MRLSAPWSGSFSCWSRPFPKPQASSTLPWQGEGCSPISQVRQLPSAASSGSKGMPELGLERRGLPGLRNCCFPPLSVLGAGEFIFIYCRKLGLWTGNSPLPTSATQGPGGGSHDNHTMAPRQPEGTCDLPRGEGAKRDRRPLDGWAWPHLPRLLLTLPPASSWEPLPSFLTLWLLFSGSAPLAFPVGDPGG